MSYFILQNKVIIKAKLFKWTSRGKNITLTTARSTTVDMENISCSGDKFMDVLITSSVDKPKRNT